MQNFTHKRYVRGADGGLYALVDGAYERAEEGNPGQIENKEELLTSDWSRSDSLSARLLIDPGDGASARLLIEPGDAQAGRLLVEPGELIAA